MQPPYPVAIWVPGVGPDERESGEREGRVPFGGWEACRLRRGWLAFNPTLIRVDFDSCTVPHSLPDGRSFRPLPFPLLRKRVKKLLREWEGTKRARVYDHPPGPRGPQPGRLTFPACVALCGAGSSNNRRLLCPVNCRF